MKNNKRFLIVSVFMLCICALSLFLIIFTDYKAEGFAKVMSITVSLMLWISLFVGYIFMILFYRKSSDKKLKGKIGLISFFTNKFAVITDLLMILSVILMVVLSLLNVYTNVIYALLVSIFFISLNLHCVFNGKIFNNIISKKRGREE